MRFVLSPYIAIPVLVIALLVAISIWYVLVRPVPEKWAKGVIVGQTFRSEETVEKSVPRTSRSLEHYSKETKYTLPDRFIYSIRLDNEETEVRYSMPALGNLKLENGQRVKVVYLERSIPFIWKKFYVKEMTLIP
jgi:hypothetical protein